MGLLDTDNDQEQEAAPDADNGGGLLGGPVANITAANMPQFQAPQNTPAPGWQGGIHGLFDKLEEGVKTAASQAGEHLMPTPTALRGLLSPDDVSDARRKGLLSLGIALSQGRGENPLQSLGRGLQAAQEGFKDHLSDVVQQRKEAEAEQARMQTIQTQQRLLTSRAQIAQQYQAKPNETPQQTDARLRQMATAYANTNDPDMASKIGTLIKDLREPAAPALHTINAGNKQITVGPDGKTIREDPVGENPAQVARDARAAAQQTATEARLAAQEARQANAEKQATIRQQNVIVHDFNKVAEVYHGAEDGYAVLKAAKASPNNFMQPMAALDALARMLNPKGAVRVGTLQILKSQGSIGDRVERSLTMLKSGKWPEGMQQEVFDMADNIMRQHTEDFETARQEAIDRGDAQGVDVRALLHKSQTIKGSPAADTGPYGKRPK